MSAIKTIGIVIPTYGRPDKITRTLHTLFKSHIESIPLPIPVVVVDDGSQPPIKSALDSVPPPSAFTLKYIYQTNAGPAAARNTGFKALDTDIVLFLDDDIDLLPDALHKHYTFHTQEAKQPSVYYGITPSIHEWRQWQQNGLVHIPESHSPVRTFFIASGHISMPRTIFDDDELPYNSKLHTPVAEEYELAYRLYLRSVPIFVDYSVIGIHHVPPSTLEYLTKREYRHGVALGEATQKAPVILSLSNLPQLLRKHHPYKPQLSIGWLLKALFAHTGGYKLATRLPFLSNRYLSADAQPLWVRLITGAAMMAGIREGLSKFRSV